MRARTPKEKKEPTILEKLHPRPTAGSGNNRAVTIADKRQLAYIQRQAQEGAVELEYRQQRDKVQLALAYHRTRTGVAGIVGAAASVPVGIVSGLIAAILDGAADGISLVAPVVAPPLTTFVLSLAWQTHKMAESFSWTWAGQVAVMSLWRAGIVLLGVLTIIGAWQWYQRRMDRPVIQDYFETTATHDQSVYDQLTREGRV